MADNSEVLVTAGGVAQAARVKAYRNRLEVSYPRMLTMGLTRKTETYPYRSMEAVEVKGGTLRFKLGTMSTRTLNVGRGKAKQIADLIRQSM